jgi:23S rRNA pseudouridine955/2504/2580 synthase
MHDVRQFQVAQDDDGQRLDRWLKKTLPRVPYALLQKMVRTGQVRVDGKRAKTDTRLFFGQTVRLPPLEDKPRVGTFTPHDDDESFLNSITLYDDGEILILNKPYGLPVQGGPHIRRHIDGMLGTLVNKKGVRPRLVHRLDRDTSGVLVCARSLRMTQSLGRLFEGRDIKKVYYALISPPPRENGGDIEGGIIKGEGARKEAVVIDNMNGKPSRTSYKIIAKNDDVAFAAFWPRTGRMHQIRVHTADVLKSPIIGDEKYGGLSPLIETHDIDGRLHLHAACIVFKHPTTQEILNITAPLPSELVKSWNAFNFPLNPPDPF